MRLAICNELFRGWNPAAVFACARSLGYDGVEVAPFTIAESVDRVSTDERRRLREQAAEHHISIIGTHWLLVSPPGLSATSPDPEIRRRTASCLVSLVDFTADIGGDRMVFGSPLQRSVPAGTSRAEAEHRLAETLRPCLRRARERSVTVCLEPLARRETDLINTAEEAVAFIRRLGHPNLRLTLDVKAMSDEGRPIPEIIRHSAEFLGHVHVNDASGSAPGSGAVEFGPIISALREAGYDGWLSVELFDSPPDPEAAARASISCLRRFL